MNTEQLNIENLAPYLPYGLRIKILNHKNDYTGIEESVINGLYFLGDNKMLHVTYDRGNTGKSVREFKPYMRPLSQLTRELLESLGWTDHLDYFTNELHWQMAKGNVLRAPYDKIQMLLKNHYDIFDLIGSGLALELPL